MVGSRIRWSFRKCRSWMQVSPHMHRSVDQHTSMPQKENYMNANMHSRWKGPSTTALGIDCKDSKDILKHLTKIIFGFLQRVAALPRRLWVFILTKLSMLLHTHASSLILSFCNTRLILVLNNLILSVGKQWGTITSTSCHQCRKQTVPMLFVDVFVWQKKCHVLAMHAWI